MTRENLSDLAARLRQDPLGARFEAAAEHFVLAPSTAATALEAAADRTTRQLHEVIRLRADELAERAKRLSNQAAWRPLSSTADKFRDLVSHDVETVADSVGL